MSYKYQRKTKGKQGFYHLSTWFFSEEIGYKHSFEIFRFMISVDKSYKNTVCIKFIYPLHKVRDK